MHSIVYQAGAALIVMGLANPWILVILPFIVTALYCLFTYSITSYRENKRIESVTISPILNLLGETYNGCSTIKAFEKQD